MGKKSRQRMASNQPVEEKPGWVARILQGAKDRIQRGQDKVNDKVQDALDHAQQRAVEKYIKNGRFMELSHCNHPNFIKWDDPQISLEVKLCDIRNLKLIRNGKHLDQFLEILTDEERDLYLNFKGYEGHNYRELENGNLLIEMVKGVKERWKENRRKAKEQGKADDITPEEEKAIDEAFDSLLQDD